MQIGREQDKELIRLHLLVFTGHFPSGTLKTYVFCSFDKPIPNKSFLALIQNATGLAALVKRGVELFLQSQ